MVTSRGVVPPSGAPRDDAHPREAQPTIVDVWALLDTIPDPELPMLSVCDLGIVREVTWTGPGAAPQLEIVVTPTYTGCPASRVIAANITAVLRSHGVSRVHVETRLAPAWTTDWLSPAGRRKLANAGIAPPVATVPLPEGDAARRLCYPPPRSPAVACPRCRSAATHELSAFGATPCMSLHRCDACGNPFEHLKCH